jgi:GNAT superfamily N-acetyltransferase
LTELRRPTPIDLGRHDREPFGSGEAGLDQWLKTYAGQSRRRDTAAVWVIADRDDVVVAYASLSMTGIDLSGAPARLRKGSPDPIPALLLGRLAVDERFAGLGLGTELVKHALATAVEVNAKVACRAVVVTAINQGVRCWWGRFGFAPLEPGDPEGLDLYLMTSDVEATLQRV